MIRFKDKQSLNLVVKIGTDCKHLIIDVGQENIFDNNTVVAMHPAKPAIAPSHVFFGTNTGEWCATKCLHWKWNAWDDGKNWGGNFDPFINTWVDLGYDFSSNGSNE